NLFKQWGLACHNYLMDNKQLPTLYAGDDVVHGPKPAPAPRHLAPPFPFLFPYLEHEADYKYMVQVGTAALNTPPPNPPYQPSIYLYTPDPDAPGVYWSMCFKVYPSLMRCPSDPNWGNGHFSAMYPWALCNVALNAQVWGNVSFGDANILSYTEGKAQI